HLVRVPEVQPVLAQQAALAALHREGDRGTRGDRVDAESIAQQRRAQHRLAITNATQRAEGEEAFVFETNLCLLGTRYRVLGTRSSVLGTGYWVLGTRYRVLGTLPAPHFALHAAKLIDVLAPNRARRAGAARDTMGGVQLLAGQRRRVLERALLKI